LGINGRRQGEGHLARAVTTWPKAVFLFTKRISKPWMIDGKKVYQIGIPKSKPGFYREGMPGDRRQNGRKKNDPHGSTAGRVGGSELVHLPEFQGPFWSKLENA